MVATGIGVAGVTVSTPDPAYGVDQRWRIGSQVRAAHRATGPRR
jgi:hypothetical protein